MKDVIIISIENANSEGVTLILNKKASLKTGNVYGTQIWVSWDKIGEALIDGYTQADSVAERNALRGKP